MGGIERALGRPNRTRPIMEDRELRKLTAEVSVADAVEPFGAYMFGTDEPGAELGRHLERVVLLEAFGNTADDLALEYGPYEESSLFIVVVDHLRQRPAGVMRVVQASPAGLKSLNDVESLWGEQAEVLMRRTGLDFTLDKIWDIATLAVPPEYRAKATGGLVTMGLYQTLTLAARASGIELFVAILDMPVFRMLRWKLKMIFAGYKGVGPKPYLGSLASIPAWCDVLAADRHIAAVDPDLYRILTEGSGLEPALRRADLSLITGARSLPDTAAAG